MQRVKSTPTDKSVIVIGDRIEKRGNALQLNYANAESSELDSTNDPLRPIYDDGCRRHTKERGGVERRPESRVCEDAEARVVSGQMTRGQYSCLSAKSMFFHVVFFHVGTKLS